MSISTVSYVYAYANYMRPDGFAENNWPLGTFASIDEVVRDDTDYISSKEIQQNKSDRVAFSLTNGIDPEIDNYHVVRYAFREDGLSSDSPRLEVRLKEGTTVLATWIEPAPLPTVFTLATHEVPAAAVHQIGDYSNLRLEFEAICTTSGNLCDNTNPQERVSISWAELQYEIYPTSTPRDHPPPQITGLGFYNITKAQMNNSTPLDKTKFSYSKQTDIADSHNYGIYDKSGKFFPSNKPIPTFTGQVNNPIQLQVRLQGVFASTKIEHLSLISSSQKISSEFTPANFEIIADKGKKPIVIDPHDIFKKVSTSYSLENGYLWVNLDLIFQKPVEKSDIILQSWDEQRIPVYLKMPNAWTISDPSIMPEQKKIVPRAIVRIADIALSSCNATDSCFEPSHLQIPKGGIITWINDDVVLHTVMSGDPKNGHDGRFNFAMIPGKIHEKKFDTIGTYKYYCSIHPWNTGIITVSENTAAETAKYPLLNVISKPLWKMIRNDQKIVLPNHDLNVIIFGSIPEIKKPVLIDVIIQKPDKSIEKLSVKTKHDGQYNVPATLSKTWQKGTYKIVLVYLGKEMNSLSFVVSERN